MKIRVIIFTLTLNLPILFLNVNPIQAQSNYQDRFPNDVFSPPYTPDYSSNFLPSNEVYTLDKGDVIKVTVFGLPEQGGVQEIFTDGTVTFPLIGKVNVRGKTVTQVNNLMTDLYSRFLKRPIVTVTLEQTRPLNVAIVGEVNSPGYYTISSTASGSLNNTQNTSTSIKKNPKVTDLLTLAGGLTVSANVKQIKLKRIQNQQEIIYNLDFWKLLQDGDLNQNVDLKDGDIIIVSKQDRINAQEYQQLVDATFGIKYIKAPRVTIVGEVLRPGAYTVPIEGSLPRLTTALQLTGGIKELADIRNITVTRTTRDVQEKTITIDLWEMLQSGDIEQDIILREGDKINIPKAEDIEISEAQVLASANFAPKEIFVNVVGSVVNPGATSVPPNTSLNSAILAAGGFDQQRANRNTVELIRVNPNGTVSKRNIAVNLGAEVNEENNPILKNNDVIIVNRSTLTVVSDTLNKVLAPFTSVFSFVRLFGF